jgi:glycosyltransferase involved in cell wall biosynthesis
MIDIIIPVYNVPIIDFKRCLNSIENQTYKNYKVYIVDDESDENLHKFIDEYCSKNNKFIVKHVKRGGVSNARNVGIEISTSEYLTFVDSDDAMTENFLQEAYNLIENNNLDLIIGGYKEINGLILKERKSIDEYIDFDHNNKILLFDKLVSSYNKIENKNIGNAPLGRIYSRLYKRSSIGDLRFKTQISQSEDTLFMIELIDKIDKIGLCNKIWYDYYINDYSLSHNNTNVKKHWDFINEIYNKAIKEDNPIKKNVYKIRILKASKYLYSLTSDLKSIKNEESILSTLDVELDKYINIDTNFYEYLNELKKCITKNH